jgi:hypothetical protein
VVIKILFRQYYQKLHRLILPVIFPEKKITLDFDEYIQLQNANQELIISPVPKEEPAIESKLKTLTIRIKDTLEANTTYTLNFGNAIRDINEGNIARNFTYIFSTGSTFDSLTLSGKVVLAVNGKVDTTIIVMLHKNGDDSAVVNEKPRYLTRLDSSGNFRFRNLPSGTFYIYALQDEGTVIVINPKNNYLLLPIVPSLFKTIINLFFCMLMQNKLPPMHPCPLVPSLQAGQNPVLLARIKD